MTYDKEVHIPQLVEMFVQDFRAGDIEKLQNDKTLLLKLIDHPEFKNFIGSCETIRDKKTQELFKKAQEAVKILLETKNPEELFVDLAEIQNDLSGSLMGVERDYWETIFSKLTETIHAPEETP